MVRIDSGLGETRVFQHYFFFPRKLTELTDLISVSLHRPSPASCKSLMFRQVRGCGCPSPSPVLFSLFPSSFCWLKIFVRTLGARGGKEVASPGSPHSAPSPRRETGLIAGRRSKSPSLPRKAGGGCWAVGHMREGHGGEVGWAWNPVMGGSRARLDVLGSAWESEPFSVVSWLHPCSGLARARGVCLELFPRTSFQESRLAGLGRGKGQNLRNWKPWTHYFKAGMGLTWGWGNPDGRCPGQCWVSSTPCLLTLLRVVVLCPPPPQSLW